MDNYATLTTINHTENASTMSIDTIALEKFKSQLKAEEIKHEIEFHPKLYENIDKIIENVTDIDEFNKFNEQDFRVAGSRESYKLPNIITEYAITSIDEKNKENIKLLENSRAIIKSDMNTAYIGETLFDILHGTFSFAGLAAFATLGLKTRKNFRNSFKTELDKNYKETEDKELYLTLCSNIKRTNNQNDMCFIPRQCYEITQTLHLIFR